MSLNKNTIITVDIVDFTFEGLGVAKFGELAVFVHGAVIGDKAKIKILAVKKRYAYAKVEELLSASSIREKPKCQHFGKCGGCSLQHINYNAELNFKKKLISDAFNKANINTTNPNSEIIIHNSKEYNYRNKCSLPIRRGKEGEILIGFFRKKSHDIINIVECPLQSTPVAPLVAALKSWILSSGTTPYCEQTHTGNLRHITMRSIGGKTVICLVLNETRGRSKYFNLATFASALEKLYGDNFTLWVNYNTNKTNVIYGSKFSLAASNDTPVLLDGLQLKVHPAGFFQVNDNVREMLFNYVETLTKDIGANTIIEAYAGQGVLAAKLHKYASVVFAIEICKESIESGREMAQLNGIKNLNFVLGDCAIELGKVLSKILKKENNTMLILDPPRSGLCNKTIAAVATTPPPHIIYISCNPLSLARDIAALSPQYRIADITAFDMFAKTLNVETVVHLVQSA